MLRDQPLPPLARALGLAGLIPFVAGALLVFVTEGWNRNLSLLLLASYGAVILSFLGAVHWGFALAAPDPAAAWPRLVGGVLPALWAWPCAGLLPPSLGCVGLAIGLGLWLAVEEAALRRGWTPASYQRLRRLLSAVAATCLIVAAVVAMG